jgi:hypothetical protein
MRAGVWPARWREGEGRLCWRKIRKPWRSSQGLPRSPRGCKQRQHILLDLARCPWYLAFMIGSMRIVNVKHVARVCWAVEGVVR